MLGADDIRRYLTELGEELEAVDARGELFLVGGAAMALAYNTRRATRDLDAVFEPKAIVYAAARRVAERHDDLPEEWLNDAVKGFMLGDDPAATVVFDHAGVRVRVASPRYLFAMKAAASRVERDADDIATLYRLAGFTSIGDALDHLTETYPFITLSPRVLYLLEALAEAGRL
ncbi:MAG: hypothetical protein H0V33_01545 [Acidimicrobiia bacterium]|nr:hypothetical protein [Acidimicrobiia bacterium]